MDMTSTKTPISAPGRVFTLDDLLYGFYVDHYGRAFFFGEDGDGHLYCDYPWGRHFYVPRERWESEEGTWKDQRSALFAEVEKQQSWLYRRAVAVAKQYRPASARGYLLPYFDEDDAYDCCLQALLRGGHKAQARKEENFRGYIHQELQQILRVEISKRRRQAQALGKQVVDYPLEKIPEEISTRHVVQERIDALVETVRSETNWLDWSMVEQSILHERIQRSIGEDMGITGSRVGQRIKRVLDTASYRHVDPRKEEN